MIKEKEKKKNLRNTFFFFSKINRSVCKGGQVWDSKINVFLKHLPIGAFVSGQNVLSSHIWQWSNGRIFTEHISA